MSGARRRGWLLLALCCAGCGQRPGEPGPPRFVLEGSLGQLMGLGYDEARLRFAPLESLALDFVRIRPLSGGGPDGGDASAGNSEDLVLQLAYRLQGDDPPNRQRIDLTFLDVSGGGRTALARNVSGDPRRTFPPLRVGSLFLERAPNNDAPGPVAGEFNLTFQNGAEVASGRTVFGRFSARVVPP